MRRLISIGVDLHARDNDGYTAMHARFFREECVSLFLAAGVDVNAQSRDGTTVLHLVATLQAAPPKMCLHIVDILLAGGADPGIRDGRGRTAMESARRNGCPWMQERLSCMKLP